MTIRRQTWLAVLARQLGFSVRPKSLKHNRGRRRLMIERLDHRQMLAGDVALTGSPWQNAENPLDVDADGQVAPIDVLIVANDLNANGPRQLSAAPHSAPYLDVDGDHWVTAADVDILIAHFASSESSAASSLFEPTELIPIPTPTPDDDYQYASFDGCDLFSPKKIIEFVAEMLANGEK